MTGINLFRNASDAVAYPAGQTIFSEGDSGEQMYAVVSGEVEIVTGGKVLEMVSAGGVFGEMALIDHNPRSASAIAKTDCQVVAVDEKRFQFLVQQTPFFALQMMRILAARLRRTTHDI